MLTTKLKNLPSGGSIQGPKVPQLYFRFSHSFWIIAIFVSVAFKLLFYFTKIIVFSLVNYTNHNHTVKFTWIFRMLTVWWFVNIFKILIIHSSVPPSPEIHFTFMYLCEHLRWGCNKATLVQQKNNMHKIQTSLYQLQQKYKVLNIKMYHSWDYHK